MGTNGSGGSIENTSRIVLEECTCRGIVGKRQGTMRVSMTRRGDVEEASMRRREASRKKRDRTRVGKKVGELARDRHTMGKWCPKRKT